MTRLKLLLAILMLAAATATGVFATHACVELDEQAEPMQIDQIDVDLPLGEEAAGRELEIRWLPPSVARFQPLFVEAALRHGIDPNFLAIITVIESGGWSQATSRSGARGLMQIMPATGAIIADERGLTNHDTDKLFDPAYNIDFGAWYLARQLARFATDDATESVVLAGAAYNGGPTRLRRHLDGEAKLSNETTRYKRWVKTMWRDRQLAASSGYRAWLAAGGYRLVARGTMEMVPPKSP